MAKPAKALPHETAAIYATPGAPADHRITYRHLGNHALMYVGFRRDTAVHDDPNGTFAFSIAGRHRRVIVKLTAADLYDIEIGRVQSHTFAWVSEATAAGIQAADLSGTLIRLYQEATA